jgi:hypothetical protein
MARPRKQEQETTAVEIFKGSDGYWHGFLIVGMLPDGSADRRHRQGKSENVVRRKILDLQGEVAASRTPKVGPLPKVAGFLTEWFTAPTKDGDAAPDTERTTGQCSSTSSLAWASGASTCSRRRRSRTFLKSLRRTPDQEAEGRELGIRPKGLSDASVHAVYRVLRPALNDAVRWRIIARNPMDFMTWKPKNPENEITHGSSTRSSGSWKSARRGATARVGSSGWHSDRARVNASACHGGFRRRRCMTARWASTWTADGSRWAAKPNGENGSTALGPGRVRSAALQNRPLSAPLAARLRQGPS